MDNLKEIKIETPFIKLGQLLKLANVVSQGSDAKHYILEGFVSLNGTVVYERGKKIYPQNIVTVKVDSEIVNLKVI